MRFGELFQRFTQIAPVMVIGLFVLVSSTNPPGDTVQRARAFTRSYEFDFVGWELDALKTKLNQLALGSSRYLSSESQRRLVLDYLELVAGIQRAEYDLNIIYTDPGISDPQAASLELRQQLDEMFTRRQQLAPVVEEILQNQLSNVAGDMGLTFGGQPVPPVLYHSTSLPWALIISPREEIRQIGDISLVPELTVDQHAGLETQVDEALDVSSLVVGIGGIGLYPTMVSQTSNLNWLGEVVAHEWVHNFLTLRPLGLNYFSSPELRTMNETAASIAGKEIGLALLERYYPEFLPPPPPPPTAPGGGEPPPPPPRRGCEGEGGEQRRGGG